MVRCCWSFLASGTMLLLASIHVYRLVFHIIHREYASSSVRGHTGNKKGRGHSHTGISSLGGRHRKILEPKRNRFWRCRSGYCFIDEPSRITISFALLISVWNPQQMVHAIKGSERGMTIFAIESWRFIAAECLPEYTCCFLERELQTHQLLHCYPSPKNNDDVSHTLRPAFLFGRLIIPCLYSVFLVQANTKRWRPVVSWFSSAKSLQSHRRCVLVESSQWGAAPSIHTGSWRNR